MNSKFKPTLALEMDLMKSLLQDIKKLKRTQSEEIAEDFWLNQQNKALYLILKEEFQKKQNANAFQFYVHVLNIADKTIANFDETVYEELFEVNFNFSIVFLDYYKFFKSKKVVKIMKELTYEIEENQFDIDEVLVNLDLVKKEISVMLRR